WSSDSFCMQRQRMSAGKHWIGIAGLGLAVLSASSLVVAQTPTIEELQAQIEQLHAQIDELKAARSGPASRDVDAVMARVLADAEKRSQLLQTVGFTAGYSGGTFVLQSEDGNFT